MSKAIDHYSVATTRPQIARDSKGRLKRTLVVETDLVLLSGDPYHSDRAVAELLDVVGAYQAQQGIAEILVREVDR